MTHRVFGVMAAGLFALFDAAGVVALIRTMPGYSCSGVSPQHSGGSVGLAGSNPG